MPFVFNSKSPLNENFKAHYNRIDDEKLTDRPLEARVLGQNKGFYFGGMDALF